MYVSPLARPDPAHPPPPKGGVLFGVNCKHTAWKSVLFCYHRCLGRVWRVVPRRPRITIMLEMWWPCRCFQTNKIVLASTAFFILRAVVQRNKSISETLRKFKFPELSALVSLACSSWNPSLEHMPAIYIRSMRFSETISFTNILYYDNLPVS